MMHLDPALPSARIRIIALAPHLRTLGFDVRLVEYGDWRALRAPADVVVLQKKLPAFADALRLRLVRSPIVFDFDDAVMFRVRPKKGSYFSATRQKRFDRLTRIASGFVAGNAFLASQLPAGKPVVVAPSPVPDDVPRRTHGEGAVLRVGWVGMSQNLRFLAALEPVWRRLDEKGVAVELVVVSDEAFDSAACTVTYVPWTVDAQHEVLATCDVGIMPLDGDTPWTRGKCAYKLLQYMAAELPVVGSDVGMNREVVVPGVEGYLASSVDEWVDALTALASSVERRRTMGAAGRRRIESEMTYPIVARRWASLLEQL